MNASDPQRDALRMIAARAASDSGLRQKLITDPARAVLEITGVAVPPNLRIRFIEKPPDIDLLIVLPDVAPEDAELTQDELDAVAGGTNWCDPTCETDTSG
jgi:hypothetical protein